MRARARLERPARTEDDLGGASLAWADEGDVWAAIEAASAGAAAAFDTAASISAYRVTINCRDGVRAGWRIVWGERVFRIVAVRDEGAPRIILNCEEERR